MAPGEAAAASAPAAAAAAAAPSAAAVKRVARPEVPWIDIKYHGDGPAGHYNLYDRNLPKRNAVVAGAVVLFVGSVYAYTLRAVGSNNELAKAVRAYELEQEEQAKAAAAAPPAPAPAPQ